MKSQAYFFEITYFTLAVPYTFIYTPSIDFFEFWQQEQCVEFQIKKFCNIYFGEHVVSSVVYTV